MSTVGAAATSAGGYMYEYIRLCMYIMLYYTIDMYYYVCLSVKKVSVRTTKSTF